MATVRREITIDATPERVWAVLRDFAHGPGRMAPGFVVGTELVADNIRVVTFADGTALRERLIDSDDSERRFVYSIIGDSVVPEHDNAVFQVFPDGTDGSRFVWTHDVLPAALAEAWAPGMENGMKLFKQTLEQ